MNPIIAYRERKTCAPNDVPTCEHGRWTFARADFKTRRYEVALPRRCLCSKVRLAQGRPPQPAHPARDQRWRVLYRRRAAVEREFGR
ncbi:MAG: hypothetical protein ACRELC_02955 [Gemmatimonadota bacterium]